MPQTSRRGRTLALASISAVCALGAVSPTAQAAVTFDLKVSPTISYPPAIPGDLAAVPTETGVTLSWTAPTGPGSYVSYDVTVDGKTTRATGTSTTISGLTPNRDYTASIVGVDDRGAKGTPAYVAFKTTGGGLPPKPPTAPTEVPIGFADVTSREITLKWGASTDDVGVAGYRIRYDEETITVGPDALSHKLKCLRPGSEYYFEIVAFDADGLESAPLDVLVTTASEAPGGTNIDKPRALTAGQVGPSSVELRWLAPQSGCAKGRYVVYQDGQIVKSVDEAFTTVDGLKEKTTYRFSVVSYEGLGDSNQLSDEIVVTTPAEPSPQPIALAYSVNGAAQLKTLTKGSLPLTGGVDADVTIADGTFEADLALKPTQGRLIALGFIPVTAKVAFVTSGRTTGLLDDGTLTTKSLVRIKLPEVKLFGAVPLAGGNNCQTKSLSTIALTSTDEFKPFAGGSLAGSFAISDLNGCGVLNGLVSPLTSGGGNAITLKLTAKSGQ